MRDEYDFSGGERGKYVRPPKVSARRWEFETSFIYSNWRTISFGFSIDFGMFTGISFDIGPFWFLAGVRFNNRDDVGGGVDD
jgi:hypothetical protein